jgi:DNA-binding NarL/FixJ family response regulator
LLIATKIRRRAAASALPPFPAVGARGRSFQESGESAEDKQRRSDETNGSNTQRQPVQQSSKARVLVVHSLPLVRFGLARLIATDRRFVLCAKNANAPMARELFVREQAHLVILGLTLSGGDGIELIKDFRKLNPLARSVVFSTRSDRLWIERAFRAGAHGYLLASEGTAEVLHALSRVSAGHFYASELLLRQIVDKGQAQIPTSEIQHLTDRELQVLSLIGRGFGASRLAHELHLSVKTIETYQMHLKEKLGLHSATELSAKASEWMVRSARENLQLRHRMLHENGR